MSESHDEPRRPRDLALLLLAAECQPARLRARDQQADLAGLALRRELLGRLAECDPDADRLADTLTSLVIEAGEPSGPTRSVAISIWQDWEMASGSAGYWSWLISEAIARSDPRRPGREAGDHVA